MIVVVKVLLTLVSMIVMIVCGVIIQETLNRSFGRVFLREHKISEFVIVGLGSALVGMALLDKFRGCL